MIFNESWLFIATTKQFDKSINLFSLVFLTLEFLFTVRFYNSHNMFPLFWYKLKSDDFIYNWAIFFNNIFIAFDFIAISDLVFNPKNLIEILSFSDFLVSWLDRSLMYLNISLIALKIFFVRINSNKLTTKLLFVLLIHIQYFHH